MHHVGRLDVRAKGRIGQDDVEPAFKDAVDVQEAVMVMHAAVAVAVHDHVHLAGAGHAVVGVGAVDAAVGELPEARAALALVECCLDFVKLCAQQLQPSSLRIASSFPPRL